MSRRNINAVINIFRLLLLVVVIIPTFIFAGIINLSWTNGLMFLLGLFFSFSLCMIYGYIIKYGDKDETLFKD